MRLIDADALINGINNARECVGLGTTPLETFLLCQEAIRNCPTAYDVEAVVAELEKVSFERFGNDGMGGQKVVSLDDAISIVRGKE